MLKQKRTRKTKQNPRNLFTTTTGTTLLVSIAMFILATAPNIQGLLNRRVTDIQKQDLNDLVQIVSVLAYAVIGISGAGGVLAAKYNLDPNTFTPRFLPGRNKEDTPAYEDELK